MLRFMLDFPTFMTDMMSFFIDFPFTVFSSKMQLMKFGEISIDSKFSFSFSEIFKYPSYNFKGIPYTMYLAFVTPSSMNISDVLYIILY
ncbi:hypothetical protein DSECCO2_386530 [anaerobic digester metagenome]